MYILQIDEISKQEKEEILDTVRKINRRRKHYGKKRAPFLMYKKELLITEITRSKGKILQSEIDIYMKKSR